MPLVVSIHRRLHGLRQSHEVKFYWDKSHVGIEGNELADQHAKEAASTTAEFSYAAYPICYPKRLIQLEMLVEWQREYTEETTGSSTKHFFPTIDDAKLYREIFGISFEMTQLFTGHGFNKTYLKRFTIINEDTCPCDNRAPQTMRHLLQDCPRYDCARYHHRRSCQQHEVPDFDLNAIAKQSSLIKSFTEFVKHIISNLKAFNGTT
ncbi:uncharacterized protein LOC118754064 [Rhagoletis pomonella]|uniref:uncharacterized protein LOC118754064 n=1 Tax=Rhagoletis pomonella TaxID=28610 RepID=UPI0017823A9B|nr:uncharacterized protein LOC118754064 [Rhagoletis pomonella]